MMEYAEVTEYYHYRSVDWREMPKRAITDGDLRFDHYVYRIDGRVYIVQNKEFDVDFERVKIWAMMGGK